MKLACANLRALLLQACALGGGLLGSASALATGQLPDLLVEGDKQYEIYACTLCNRPVRYPGSMGSCSALWRGHVERLELKDQKLYLLEVRAGNCGEETIPMEKVFPGKSAPIFVDWWSGIINVPVGPRIATKVLREFGPVYASYREVHIDKGRVTSEEAKPCRAVLKSFQARCP